MTRLAKQATKPLPARTEPTADAPPTLLRLSRDRVDEVARWMEESYYPSYSKTLFLENESFQYAASQHETRY